eukprot:scaffold3068_cov401-Prasinococcus_capsulatus_cf.AAC.7
MRRRTILRLWHAAQHGAWGAWPHVSVPHPSTRRVGPVERPPRRRQLESGARHWPQTEAPIASSRTGGSTAAWRALIVAGFFPGERASRRSASSCCASTHRRATTARPVVATLEHVRASFGGVIRMPRRPGLPCVGGTDRKRARDRDGKAPRRRT